jgi:lipopolysaccharide transport system ATP-binding protein
MSSDTAIKVNNLGKCYQIYNRPKDRLLQSLWRGRKQFYREFWALRDISFEVKRGEMVGIIGRNGVGKSTLLQLIAGTLTPTTGSIEVNGRVAALLELGSGFNPEFTGRENVFINGAILGISSAEMKGRFDEIADFADIGDFIDQPVKTYSSGMIVRLAFSVSVCVDPEVLLVDEALAVGDASFQYKCIERLEKLAKSGTTILFVSHDTGLVKAFCNSVIYLAEGCERASGPADEMVELYALDIRDQQRKTMSGTTSVKLKKSIGGDKGFAFGTEEGRVVMAEFADTGSLRSVFKTGDEVRLRVDVEFLSTVKNPCVSIIVQDYRMIPVGGRYFLISARPWEDGLCRSTVFCSFKADLAEGNYFLTVRLEDRQSDTQFLPIDKQAGALSFEMLYVSSKDFLGIVDLKMDCVEEGVEV